MATVLIAGGTGLVGSAVAKALIGKSYRVIVLTRGQPSPLSPELTYANWDVKRQTIDEDAFSQCDFIVHLAGANVAEGRWTNARKKEILESRTQTSALLVKALENIPNKVSALISASAIGWYGADPVITNPTPFKETDPSDSSFLGSTCDAWENSIRKAAGRVRLVILRTGIVLSTAGGAYPQFGTPLRFGVNPILGSGKQIMSWIHIHDLVKMYIHAIEQSGLNGVFNAVAPQPVSNKELMYTIVRQKGSKSIPVHVPALALKVGLGEMSIEVLKSATVSAEKMMSTGFSFEFGTIHKAIRDLEQNR